MPLTRNQQAALQAHSHLDPSNSTSSSSSPSLSSRLRSGSGHDNLLSSADEERYSLRRHDHLGQRTDDESGKIHEDSHAALSQYGHLDSLTFGGPTNAGGGGPGTNADGHGPLSGLEQGALLRTSTDWGSFGNSAAMADDIYSHSTAPSSHHNSPYYTIPESQIRAQEAATTSFIENFSNINQREDLFAHHSYSSAKQEGEDRGVGMGSRTGGVGANVTLGDPFETPTSSKSMEHSRTFSSDNLGMPSRRLPSTQSSGAVSMGLDGMESQRMRMHLSSSPSTRNAAASTHESALNFHRHARSMGQVGAELSGAHDGLLRLTGPHMTSIEAPSLDRFGGVKSRIASQSSSLRSPSPSDRSVSSTAFVGTLSPHTSISTMRHGGDSSVDTSIDSISNSVTSMSANPSRSSSTSDELRSIGTSASSKKSNKGKTRLRNIDRKLICEAARDDPKVRQEDLAARFGIERSTVSKTLKNKEKWLVIREESEGALIIKHRNGKFPELEASLAEWAKEEARKGNAVLDVAIKHRALEIAKESGLGVDSFKASVGWIEKFRDRHELPKPTSGSSESVSAVMSGRGSGKAATGRQASHRKDGRRPGLPSQPELDSPLTEANIRDGQGEGMLVPTEEVDMAGLFSSPRSVNLRNAPSSSSISNDETASLTTHETPKASKRHYDDIDQVHKVADSTSGSSIDSGMARLHFLQRQPSEGNLLTLEDSPSLGDSAFALSSTSKRRKGGPSMASQQQPFEGHENQTNIAVRDSLRRSRSDSQHQLSDSQRQQEQRKQQQQNEQQQHHVTAAAVAAANEIRRIEGATAVLQRNVLGQQQTTGTSTSESSPRVGMSRMSRTSSSPMDRTNFYRGFGPSSEMTSPLQSHFGSNEEDQHHHHQAPSFIPPVAFNDDRRVTLDEARESLNLVLAFIARQPANLNPSDYFVLGNLQGTLSALAGQNQQPTTNQDQPHDGEMNLLGIAHHTAMYPNGARRS